MDGWLGGWMNGWMDAVAYYPSHSLSLPAGNHHPITPPAQAAVLACWIQQHCGGIEWLKC